MCFCVYLDAVYRLFATRASLPLHFYHAPHCCIPQQCFSRHFTCMLHTHMQYVHMLVYTYVYMYIRLVLFALLPCRCCFSSHLIFYFRFKCIPCSRRTLTARPLALTTFIYSSCYLLSKCVFFLLLLTHSQPSLLFRLFIKAVEPPCLPACWLPPLKMLRSPLLCSCKLFSSISKWFYISSAAEMFLFSTSFICFVCVCFVGVLLKRYEKMF